MPGDDHESNRLHGLANLVRDGFKGPDVAVQMA